MITHKDWKDFKKKNSVPDGLHPKISVGVVLDRYHKTKQTDADFTKLEDDLKLYIRECNAKGQKKAATWLQSMINTAIAERDEAKAKQVKEKQKLSAQMDKLYRGFIATLTKRHANIKTLAKAVKDNPDWWAADAPKPDQVKRAAVCAGLQKELDALFKECRDGGGETVDVSLAYANILRSVTDLSHDSLVEQLDGCLEKTKETAEHIAESL